MFQHTFYCNRFQLRSAELREIPQLYKRTTHKAVWSHWPTMHTIGILVSVSILAGIHADIPFWYDGKFHINVVFLNKNFKKIISITQRHWMFSVVSLVRASSTSDNSVDIGATHDGTTSTCFTTHSNDKYSLLMHCIKIKSPVKFLLNEQYVFVGGNISFLCVLSCSSEEA